MRRFAYFAPERLEDAVAILSEHGTTARIVAGGTDLVVQMKDGARRPAAVVNIGRIGSLRGIVERDGALHIGALTSMGTIEHDPLILTKYPVLADSAKLVGSIQIRNLASIAGNSCNASPGADTPPALLVLDVSVRTAGANGGRIFPLRDLFVGPGQTSLELGEIVVEIIVPEPEPNTGAFYLRHTPRRELDIAVVGAGAWVKLDGDTVSDVRIALAAVAPTPLRATGAEDALRGREINDESLAAAADAAQAQAKPISDVRGSAEFRTHLVGVLTRRALEGAISRAYGETPKYATS
jgi:carbon-monoxide dehydrogenase medium subunit